MRKVLKNAVIGATLSSAAVFLFSAIQRVTINVPYVWLLAFLAGVCYGWLALRFSIYGRSGVVFQNWKNCLLSFVIIIGTMIVSVRIDRIARAPAADPVAVLLAASISIIVSDALEAPNQRGRSRYSQDKSV
jgi:hypothetical protein